MGGGRQQSSGEDAMRSVSAEGERESRGGGWAFGFENWADCLLAMITGFFSQLLNLKNL
jgi:hypothetical protein